ncbi:Glutamyl-tRNA(Gln) amidotransferase subunit A [Polaromonas vacuolata]|uniref:Glutamyl-tRNA(Gln) amidotransferase subunit A n=1 Tax=Polaromonas vacuolata TaxID=37448 RepID=A0A6H2HDU2_9BURK|nr:amidase [Polaromonas vacuolata]QJC57963.1 Glutamyl-tRNA(Gln) amidotransferase subunit A [Polaromonas vacuolata]
MKIKSMEWLSLKEMSDGLCKKKFSSLEPTQHLLDRTARYDHAIKSFIHVSEHALTQAKASDARRSRRNATLGPLDGIAVALKDNYLTADMPTTAGTNATGWTFAAKDSACAQRLRAAGCVLIGKTRTHEFAWGTTSPPVSNPWDIERIPGGSSGGSAACIASGFAPLALGSDTGGSIRIPASFCGTVGFKPTFGRISKAGIVPHSWSLDHPGPLTRTVEDAAIAMNTLAGYDARDPACQDQAVPDYTAAIAHSSKNFVIGIIENHFMDQNTPEVQDAVDASIQALRNSGAKIIYFRLPLLAYGLGAIYAIELASSGAHHDSAVNAGHSSGYQKDVRALVEMGRLVSAVDYLKAEQVRSLLCEEFKRIFDQVDVVISPTEPMTAWKKGNEIVRIGEQNESVLAASWRLTYPFNLTGLPAISVPCGFDKEVMPIGLQIAGRPFDEASVLRCAAAVERLLDLKQRPLMAHDALSL